MKPLKLKLIFFIFLFLNNIRKKHIKIMDIMLVFVILKMLAINYMH
jgi:hypothetical protein